MPQCKWIVHNLFGVYGARHFNEAKMTTLYKIMTRQQWKNTRTQGFFEGSGVDLQDGFIHLSAGHQVRETAQKHFAGQADLLLVSVQDDELGDKLKWEISRGGAMFPHVYGTLPFSAMSEAVDLPWVDGTHLFPESFTQ
jgi:uncharacterized protein (DUF952 family)